MLDLRSIRVVCAAAVLSLGGLAAAVPARGAPEDQPAVEQYADPFGPLPTRDRARDVDPLSGDFAGPPSPELLRRLERAPEADRAALAALVTDVDSARQRIRQEPGADAPSHGREPESSALAAVEESIFDPGGAGGWLLAGAALIAVAAAISARRVRQR